MSIKGIKEFLLRVVSEYKDFMLKLASERKELSIKVFTVLHPVKFKKGDKVWLERFSNCLLAEIVEDRDNMRYVVQCVSTDVKQQTKVAYALVDEADLIKCTFDPDKKESAING